MEYKEIDDTSYQLNLELDNILIKLVEIKELISTINEISGINKKIIETQEEIKIFGWDSILNLFHPDHNCDNPEAHKTFDFYKFVYDNM